MREGDDDDRYSEMRASAVTVSQLPTTGQITELQRETIIREFLAVAVTKGEMLSKKKDEGRKHHGYLVSENYPFIYCYF